ncbi:MULTISPECIES: SHOCT domain-containing protein [unclassified Curtobacterium]|uniref:SHOCT domain-containing protein n=1 Tax=unclassified Curtobacterium TaxID=257496 RepID=UPI000DA844B5|nr:MULTISPECIES: SHOCT domain-containing protein [unclassified Curtobacterium]WIB64619.1 SHOCT domain-containing protein [Curtobacterium sp. MCBD17_040]WIB68461.1 SHOCT domain-containing protein [Curtobacterium sp. MCBD17_035]
MAVLLDTPAWASRSTVADRDALPLEVLENLMHWPSVQRVWMPHWLASQEAVVSSIFETLESAHAARRASAASFASAAESVDAVLDGTSDAADFGIGAPALPVITEPDGGPINREAESSPVDVAPVAVMARPATSAVLTSSVPAVQAAETAPTPVPAAAPSSLSQDEVFAALTKLADLAKAGILTEEEFAPKKAELLARL